MKRAVVIVFVILSSLLNSCTHVSFEKLDISSDWKMKTGDNSEYAKAGFDDSSWENILLGESWELQGYSGYGGAVLYRKKVVIPSSLKIINKVNPKILEICLGKTVTSDRIKWQVDVKGLESMNDGKARLKFTRTNAKQYTFQIKSKI